MSGVFDTQGITFISHWDGFRSAGAKDQLTALSTTGANTVSMVARVIQPTLSSATFVASNTATDVTTMGNLVDQAHGQGLKVTLTPHVDLPDGTARAKIVPADADAWFANYTNYIVSYATMAQAHGVEMLSLGTEMDGVMGAAYAAKWNTLIDTVRQVYHGKLTYQADLFDAGNVTFWAKMDVISVNGYVSVATNGSPTVASVAAAWHAVPTDDWLAAKFNYESPVDYFRDLSLKYGKPFQFGEIGYRNGDGAGITPGVWNNTLAPDPAEQKTLYEGFYEVFGKETSWFQGANLFDWSSTPAATADTSYDLQHSAALGLVQQWYSGANNALVDQTKVGTTGNDMLTGGSGIDHLLGGGGNDVLMGGAGDDVLIGDQGVNPLADKLVIYAKGTPAGGVDALMKVQLNGVTIATVSVPKNADNSSTAFTFDVPKGDLGKLVITFTNDAIIGKEDRNLLVQKVVVDGYTLGAEEAVNTRVPGTLNLWSYGTITWDLSKHPELTQVTDGNDTLIGGTGNDTLTGGGGNDAFVFARGSGHDVVTDFGANGDHDAIDISDYLRSGLTPTVAASGADTVIRFSTGDQIVLTGVSAAHLSATATGFIYSDVAAAASAAAPQVQAAGSSTQIAPSGAPAIVDLVRSSVSYVLGDNVNNLTLTGGDAVNGTGNARDNVLTGNGADNRLDGGAGNNTLIGGAGNDVFVVHSGDVVQEAAGGGNDAVLAQTSYTLAAGQEIEKLLAYDGATTTALTLTGNEFANTIVGNAGNDILDGGAGNDMLIGNGHDTLIGGLGNDMFVVRAGDIVQEAAGGGSDAVLAQTSYTLAAGQEIEKLLAYDGATTTALTLTGNEFANNIVGNAGNDILDGGGGNDMLIGNGHDTLIGGLGNDMFVVRAGDIVQEAAGGGNDAVLAQTSYTLAAGQEIEKLLAYDGATTTALTLTGNEFANNIVGNAGNDILDGGGGNDMLIGNGHDTLIGGAGDDMFVVRAGDIVQEAVGGGSDAVLAQTSYTLAAGQEIERLLAYDGATTTALTLTGNEFANNIVGNAGNDILDGGGGNDMLIGNGHDTLIGGAGDDMFVVRAGDVVQEAAGGGNDAVLAQTSYTLAAGQEIEKLLAYDGAATTALTLTGNEFANTIVGNAGNNTLIGGGGVDRLTGGAGADTFVFNAADTGKTAATADTILDFSHAQGDRIDLSHIDIAGQAEGHQPFSLHASGDDHVAGAVWLTQNGDDAMVNLDTDGDGKADYLIHVVTQGHTPLTSSDFIF